MLRVSDLRVQFPIARGVFSRRKAGVVRAVDGISFSVGKAETLGLVGESGCGKSTTARAILQLVRPATGKVELLGEDLTGLHGAALRRHRRDIQMVFQDPTASLDPRMKVRKILKNHFGRIDLCDGKISLRESPNYFAL